MEEELEMDLEAEVEQSKVTGPGEVKEASEMQTSVMEVDDTGEDKVVAADGGKPSGGRKCALSSPPKPSRRRHAP